MKLHMYLNFREADVQYILCGVLHIDGYRAYIFSCISILSCIYNYAKSKQVSRHIVFTAFAY